MAFLVTSSNSFPLPISIALNLSGLSLSQLELIQVPISEEQSDSNDAAISQLVTWGAGGKEQGEKRCKPKLLLIPTSLFIHKAHSVGCNFSNSNLKVNGTYLKFVSFGPNNFEPLRESLMNCYLQKHRCVF